MSTSKVRFRVLRTEVELDVLLVERMTFMLFKGLWHVICYSVKKLKPELQKNNSPVLLMSLYLGIETWKK